MRWESRKASILFGFHNANSRFLAISIVIIDIHRETARESDGPQTSVPLLLFVNQEIADERPPVIVI